MTRRNKLLAGFLIIVFVPVVTVWLTVWPILRPWVLPDVKQGEMILPDHQVLTSHIVVKLNQWLVMHRTGWGKAGEQPPGTARLQLVLKPAPPQADFYLSLWHFRHGDDVVGIQSYEKGPYRMRSLSRQEGQSLMQDVAGQEDIGK